MLGQKRWFLLAAPHPFPDVTDRFLDWIRQPRTRLIAQVGLGTFTCGTAVRGVGLSYLVQERGTGRLDAPPQARLAEVVVFCNELRDQRCGGAISVAKKADAAVRIALSRLRIALSRLTSVFSRRSRCDSADFSDATPARAAVSVSLWRTHLRTVSAVPTPGGSASACIADRCGACSPRVSVTFRTARSRDSGGCFFERDTTLFFPTDETRERTGAAQDFLGAGLRMGWV